MATDKGNSSFFRRVNQAKVTLGADPLKLVRWNPLEALVIRMLEGGMQRWKN